jgi:anti-sigma regulatory factor (Ser/Thr protein kinase)
MPILVKSMGRHIGMPEPDQKSGTGGFKVRGRVLRLEKLIPSDLALMNDTVAEVTAALNGTACWDDVVMIGVALQEALTNAIIHGNHFDREKTVSVSVDVNEDCDLILRVKDSGSGFDPSAVPNPIASENLLAPCGRGILLMQRFMDEVEFNFDHGTEVCMRRRRGASADCFPIADAVPSL